MKSMNRLSKQEPQDFTSLIPYFKECHTWRPFTVSALAVMPLFSCDLEMACLHVSIPWTTHAPHPTLQSGMPWRHPRLPESSAFGSVGRHLSCATNATIGDLLAPGPTWLVHQTSHKYWQPDRGAFDRAQHQYSKCLQNLIIFTIILWILPAIAPQRMGKEVKESFQLLDKLSIESWNFERLENDLLFAGGDYLKIPSLIMFGWPAQWTGPRHPCRVHGARTVLEEFLHGPISPMKQSKCYSRLSFYLVQDMYIYIYHVQNYMYVCM